MARLALSLLGSLEIKLDGQPVTRSATGKVRALLAYLAVEADRPHPTLPSWSMRGAGTRSR
jgi:DNA-binding SARP family transcriptional activator